MKKIIVCLCVGAGAACLLALRKLVSISAVDASAEIIYVVAKSKELVPPGKLKLPEKAALVALIPPGKPATGSFRVADFVSRLSATIYGRLLYYGPRMPSTQTFLSQNAHSLPIGTVCVSDVQYQGKGRAGNSWVSPDGCLMFSFTLQMENGRTVPFVQYVVCLAVVQGIEAAARAKNATIPDVRIKWPNDLYSGNLKIGGVLCSSTYSSKTFYIVAGVGLNVDNDEPTTCLNSVLARLDSKATPFAREELLATILESFEKLFTTFTTQGFSALELMYYEKWMHSGQKVILEDDRVSVVIEGLTPAGFLLASDDAFNKYELHPDGNSLDFFKGLVRRKLPGSAQ
ncbi:biotin--protein ligase 2 [Selaginella moellendorffii]|uniref:biotin--protein ligase 2 n=1 Tax=Selaginella moellendorffii TaxID=88036 RepID=UPI000D1C343C|nr:biotin--protein ligase 2 [Selaginella moellendorffii]|eukprot:XP_024524939.1 biotin--protein ligase 2 [Selaginella moellendorffii]